MSGSIDAGVALEMDLARLMSESFIGHLDRILKKLPAREATSVSMHLGNLMDVWPQTGIFAFQDMIDTEARRLAETAARILALREVVALGDGNVSLLANQRSAMEYEHFLYRLFGFKDKTIQAWNALRGSLLERKLVRPTNIKKQIEKSGPDAMLSELEEFWKDKNAVALSEERNIVAHRHPLGDGFLAPSRIEISPEGGRQINAGAVIGAIDWEKTAEDVETGMRLAFDAMAIVARHAKESLAPWSNRDPSSLPLPKHNDGE